jgi:hypothetical protein
MLENINYNELLTTTYVAMGLVGVAGYVPQLWALLKDTSGSRNVPLLTWIIWGFQTIAYVLYAVVVNGDPYFITIMVLTLVMTHACLYALLYNRYLRKLPHNRRKSDKI